MGKTKAFWSVLVGLPQDDTLITQEMTKDFFESGRSEIQGVIRDVSSRIPGWKLRGDVLDFGCGLGRLGVSLAQISGVDAVTCVDQSVFHMIKTEEFTAKIKKSAAFFPIVSGPDMLMALHQDYRVPKCYDFVNSLIVLQHMITPLQVVYLEQFCDVLKPGGIARFQIPSHTPMDPACDDSSREEYRRSGGMQMHYIDESSVSHAMERRGCTVSIVNIGTNYVGEGHNSMMVYARKKSSYGFPCVD